MPISRINTNSIANNTIQGADLLDASITAAKIISVANTQITGNIVSSQITSVANTQITGNIVSSQITSNPTLYGNVSVVGTASIGASDAIMTIGDNRRTVSTSTTTGAIVSGGGLGVWGDVYMGGNLSVAGGQIKFPASQSASSDANTLDDYEEGTFTPTFTASGSIASFTYVTQLGSYVKIGKTVYFALEVQISSLAGGSSGNARISNLPFTASITSTYGAVSIAYAYVVGGTQPNGAMVRNGTTNIELFSNSGGGVSSIGFGSLSALDWYIGGTYTV
jgi:hypothetical protein